MDLTLYLSFFLFFIFFVYILVYKSCAFSTSKITTPDQALQLLLQGNKKYTSFWNFRRKADRKSVAIIQRPFAIILSCSDSRVPTEIIFNQLNLGNLFIIRNAGNVVDGVVLGSIEYGIDQLGAVLIIVLGHERCGAVTATIDHILEKKPESACHIKDIINAIYPAAVSTLQQSGFASQVSFEAQTQSGRLRPDKQIPMPVSEKMKVSIIEQTVKQNVISVMQKLPQESAIIQQAVTSGKIKIVGAFYDLGNGEVQILG